MATVPVDFKLLRLSRQEDLLPWAKQLIDNLSLALFQIGSQVNTGPSLSGTLNASTFWASASTLGSVPLNASGTRQFLAQSSSAAPGFVSLAAADYPLTVADDGTNVATNFQRLDFRDTDVTNVTASGTDARISLQGYANLAGRSGGQTLSGGTATTTSLNLQGNAADQTGRVNLKYLMSYGDASGITISTPQNFNQIASSNDITCNAGYGFTALVVGSGPSNVFLPFNDGNGLLIAGAAGALGSGTVFNFNPRIRATTSQTVSLIGTFANQPRYAIDGAGITYNVNDLSGIPANVGLLHSPNFGRNSALATGTGVFQNIAAVFVGGSVAATWSGTGMYGVKMIDPAGTGVVANVGAVEVGALTHGTETFAIRSLISNATGRYFLRDIGGAQSYMAGKFTTYNNDGVSGNGVSSVVANVALTARVAAIGVTNLFTPPTTGTYIVAVYLVTTTAGNAVTVHADVTWKDDAGGTGQSSFTSLGITGNININTVKSFAQGIFYINATTGNAIAYSTTLSGAIGTGQYSIYINVLRCS